MSTLAIVLWSVGGGLVVGALLAWWGMRAYAKDEQQRRDGWMAENADPFHHNHYLYGSEKPPE